MINWISASETPFQTLQETQKHVYKKEREKDRQKQKEKDKSIRSFTKERKYVFTNLIYIPTPLHRRSVNSLGMVNSFVELQDRIFGLQLTTSQKLNCLTAYDTDIWFGLLDLIMILNDNLYKY